LAEALVFIACNDIEPSAALRVIAGGLAGSTVIDRKSSAMVSGDFTPGFRLTLHDKDLGIVRHSAEELGIRLRVTELVSEIVHQMVTGGRGGLDHSALYLIADEVARTPAAIVSGSS
jgi:2-hydroxy-3-oxopropionate reductase